MLSGKEIIKQLKNGNIIIKPFDEKQVNPNSYDVRLGDMITRIIPSYHLDNPDIADFMYLDVKDKEIIAHNHKIPDEGYILQPNTLYLASTIESTISKNYVPILEGKSSLARIGLQIHITAGFGDVGWGYTPEGITYPTWTMEITCVYPTKIYAGMKIGQVHFEELTGENHIQYNGKYQHQSIPKVGDMKGLV